MFIGVGGTNGNTLNHALFSSYFLLYYKINFHVQVETIGDAYCVAGGLHKESDTHAVQIALMALKMMELSDEVMSPHGEPIKVRRITVFAIWV